MLQLLQLISSCSALNENDETPSGLFFQYRSQHRRRFGCPFWHVHAVALIAACLRIVLTFERLTRQDEFSKVKWAVIWEIRRLTKSCRCRCVRLGNFVCLLAHHHNTSVPSRVHYWAVTERGQRKPHFGFHHYRLAPSEGSNREVSSTDYCSLLKQTSVALTNCPHVVPPPL